MDIHEKLKQAGFNPPPKPSKVDSKKANMQMKVNKATQFLNAVEEYDNRLNSAPDKDTFLLLENSVVLNYERFCESIKDILDNIAVKENITSLSDKRGLGELIRETINILGIPLDVSNAVKKLTTRNDAVHDYINSEYYDEEVLKHVSNDINEYKKYLNAIKNYLKSKNMIQ